MEELYMMKLDHIKHPWGKRKFNKSLNRIPSHEYFFIRNAHCGSEMYIFFRIWFSYI